MALQPVQPLRHTAPLTPASAPGSLGSATRSESFSTTLRTSNNGQPVRVVRSVPSVPSVPSARAAAQAPRVYASEQLFDGTVEIEITHGDARYRLRKTSLGKLILTK